MRAEFCNNKILLSLFYFLISNTIFSAHLTPSTPEETMPPAYPAPSPIGYKPRSAGDIKLSFLKTLIGDVDLVSGPVIIASG